MPGVMDATCLCSHNSPSANDDPCAPVPKFNFTKEQLCRKHSCPQVRTRESSLADTGGLFKGRIEWLR